MDKITPTKRNKFMLDVFKHIIKDFNYYDENTSFLFFGKTALILSRQQFTLKHVKANNGKFIEYKKNNEKINEVLEINMHKSIFVSFIDHLSHYGKISVKIKNKNLERTNVLCTLKLAYDTTHLPTSPYLNFFINQTFKKYGETVLHISVNSLEFETIYQSQKKILLSDIIYGEYITQLHLFIFNIDPPLTNRLTLDNVIRSQDYWKNHSDKKYEEIDYKNDSDIEKIIEILANGEDRLIIKPLSFKKFQDVELPEDEICSICMDKLEDKNTVFKTSCNHYFHNLCLSDFLDKYYYELFLKKSENLPMGIEYDMNGEVFSGAPYEYSCPNCKSECFKLECKKKGSIIEITNIENCIFQLD